MAGSNRRFALLVALPFLFLAMSGPARAMTFTVTNTHDSGGGSLRAAINSANLATGINTIDFTVTGTISLLSTLPLVTDNGLTIIGPTASSGIRIDGGGAVQVMVVNTGATLHLQNLTIADGNSVFAGGIDNEGTLTVTNCTFSGNSCSAGGAGGIGNGGTLTVISSTFSGNSAITSIGGGILNGGTLTVTNSTFSANSSGVDGGGIANESTGTLTVTNSTFSGNSASDGGGVFNDGGSVTLKGTILAAEPTGGNCAGIVTDAGFNISDDGACGLGGTSINNSTTLNLDPLGLRNNGGPTKTIALQPNSQAVDFIPVAMCAVAQDQRGFPRPDSGNVSFCDAGAFELQTGRMTVVPGSEETQIARPTTGPNADEVNTTFTFIDLGLPFVIDGGAPSVRRCDAGNDALNGIDVDLFEGTCADLATATGGLLLELSPFAVHTINGQSYGTIFQSDPPDMLQQASETVSARIVRKLLTPVDTCGEWTIHIRVAGLDTATLGLGGSNPFALVVEDGDKNEGCFDVTNAVVGSQLPLPRKIRRGAHRGRR